MMKRVLCVWFPEWPIQRLRVVRPELKGRPVILFDESPRGFQVVHCSRGEVSPGMPLAEAKTLSPHAHFEQHAPLADSEFLKTLAVECQRFSPLVGIGEEASLLMDVTGCAHLFGGEQSMIRHVRQFLSRLVSRISLADTIGAAWGVCRYGRAGVVLHGKNADALRPLPTAALRLPASIVETLNELGIRTIGQLQALPRGGLMSRFGAGVADRLSQAFGELPELLVPVRAVGPIRAVREFDEPVTDRRSLELSLYPLIEEIAFALERRQKGVQQLTCQIDKISFIIGTTGPTASVQHLWELMRLSLERLALPGEVRRIEIRATMTARRVEHQQQLISRGPGDSRELWTLLDRLGSRLGKDALLRPMLVADALPELACRLEPIVDKTMLEQNPSPVGSFRPVRMYQRPIPVEVVSLVPDGPPIRFLWNGELHTLQHPGQPERIVSGWWRGAQIRRDYFRVETTAGERFWLFRTEGRWFLHGVFE